MTLTGSGGLPDRLDEWGIRSLVWLVVASGSLLLLLVLSMLIPGADRTLPAVRMTAGELSAAVVSIALVVLTVRVATRVRALIRRYWDDRSEIAIPAAGIAHWSIVYLVVIVAYEGLRGAVLSIVPGSPVIWAYDLGFFSLGVFVLVLIGYHLIRVLDPLAAWCTARFADGLTDSDTIQTTLPVEQPTDEGGTVRKRW